MILRSVITISLVFSFTLSCCTQINLPRKEERGETVEEKFLQKFVGTWLGKGTSDGKKTRDEAKFEWLFGKRFLKINYRALDGDNYAGEGYLWFNAEKKEYEFYEFNNGR